MSLPPIILASTSPRRADLLRPLNLAFAVVPSHVKEIAGDHLTARELALVNAHRKARCVAKQHPDALVLGADTVVVLGCVLFGKPSDPAEARVFLRELAGQTHQVITGVALIHSRRHRERLFAEVTDVRFRGLTDADIDAYMKRVDPLDKAGAYAIQESGEMLVEAVFGSRSNVVGLPMERLKAELSAWSG